MNSRINKNKEKVCIEDVFPLKVTRDGRYTCMGMTESYYNLTLANGLHICSSDYEPEYIDLINSIFEAYLNGDVSL